MKGIHTSYFSLSMIVLDPAVFAEIMSHAARAYPQECCGALVGQVTGDPRRVRAAWPLTNVAADTRRRFTIDPADYMRVEKRAGEAGDELVGFYHSHPDAAATPSATDLAWAWPQFSYVIVSVGRTHEGTMTAWRVREDRSGFENEEIACRREY